VTLNKAIRFIKFAWDSVTQQTIFNCWKHTGLISKLENTTKLLVYDGPEVGKLNVVVENNLELNLISGIEMLEINEFEKIHGTLDDNNIINLVTHEEGNIKTIDESSDSTLEEPEIPKVTLKEAKNAFSVLQNYLLNAETLDDDLISMLRTIELKLQKETKSTKQLTLNNWIKPRN
jgi:hypothetical protein